MPYDEHLNPMEPDEPGGQTRRFRFLTGVGTAANQEPETVILMLEARADTDIEAHRFEVALTVEQAISVIGLLRNALDDLS